MENGDEEEGEREGWREREFPDEYCKSEREREGLLFFGA